MHCHAQDLAAFGALSEHCCAGTCCSVEAVNISWRMLLNKLQNMLNLHFGLNAGNLNA
jgi:hypothetical protein